MTDAIESAALTGKDAAFGVLRHASVTEARGHLRDEGLEIAAPAPFATRAVLDYWLALILLAGNKVQFTLKVFYQSDVCTKILDAIAKDETEAMRRTLVRDVMREFCNRTAGNAKRVFGDMGLTMGLFLPLVTRGFDEVFARKIDSISGSVDIWQLKGAVGTLTCMAEIIAPNQEEIEKFRWTPPIAGAATTSEDDGDLDFL